MALPLLLSGRRLIEIDTIARRARYARRVMAASRSGRVSAALAKLGRRAHPVPARVVIDPSRGWSGQVERDTLPLERWQELLLSAVEWLGPVPVTLLSRSSELSPLAPELVRFCNRLECEVTLYGVDGGIDDELALRLVDVGLSRACLVLGGVTPDLHAEVSGRSVGRTTGAVSALVQARERRSARLDVVVAFPCTPDTAKDLAAVLGWARQAGADGFAVTPPFLAPAASAELDEPLARRVRALEDSSAPFDRTAPGTVDALRAAWEAGDGGPGGLGPSRCPVAGLRVDIRGCGRFGSCPFHRSIGRLGPGDDLAARWAEGQSHFDALSSCARRCRHPELVPSGVAPPWSPSTILWRKHARSSR
jgi:hypothetical protein